MNTSMPKKKRKVIRCKTCKKRFAKVHKRVYCSEECSYAARLLRNREYKRKHRKYKTIWSKNIKRLCAREGCGWYFRRKHKVAYCSERCRYIAFRKMLRARDKYLLRTDPEHKAKRIARITKWVENNKDRKRLSTPQKRATRRRSYKKHGK